MATSPPQQQQQQRGPFCKALGPDFRHQEVARVMSLGQPSAYIEAENKNKGLEGEVCQFSSKEIVVKIEYKFCPNLTISDTPGLISPPTVKTTSSCRRGVEALAQLKMQQTELIILCLEDSSDWSNATACRAVAVRGTRCGITNVMYGLTAMSRGEGDVGGGDESWVAGDSSLPKSILPATYHRQQTENLADRKFKEDFIIWSKANGLDATQISWLGQLRMCGETWGRKYWLLYLDKYKRNPLPTLASPCFSSQPQRARPGSLR